MSSLSPILNFNDPLVVDTSMGADVTSTGYNVATANTLTLHAVWSAGATPVGNMSLEASLDDVTYTTIDGTLTAVSGNSGSIMYNIQDIGYKFIRVFYDRTSGTATLNVRISGKNY